MEFLMDRDISAMVGQVFDKVYTRDDDELVFENDENIVRFYHDQECCEGVEIDEIIGDLNDLIGSPIVSAKERISDENPEGVTKECQDSFTWTFYEFATNKGSVTVRWYGESNGYYSESVDFYLIRKAA